MPAPEHFDVFLSHNSKDKLAVRKLAAELKTRGLNVWLDECELVPGLRWREALEKMVQTTRSAAVLVGTDEPGPWEISEVRACLRQFIDQHLPVIPVLLPNAPIKPTLPPFLKGFAWVDLRAGLTQDGLDLLEWAITRKKPNRPLSPSVSSDVPPERSPIAPVDSGEESLGGLSVCLSRTHIDILRFVAEHRRRVDPLLTETSDGRFRTHLREASDHDTESCMSMWPGHLFGVSEPLFFQLLGHLEILGYVKREESVYVHDGGEYEVSWSITPEGRRILIVHGLPVHPDKVRDAANLTREHVHIAPITRDVTAHERQRTRSTTSMKEKRFQVALSFPGDRRGFVSQVADYVSQQLGQDQVFYDRYYEAELARPDLDIYLGGLYRDHSELVVPFFCVDYEGKKWCKLEWRQMRDILLHLESHRIMPFRFDDAPISGFLSIDGYIEIANRGAQEIAGLILQRLTLNQGGSNPQSVSRPTASGRAT